MLQAQALNFFQTWPEGVLPDPLALCIANTMLQVKRLILSQREIVMEELPKAMPKISLLLSALAHQLMIDPLVRVRSTALHALFC